MLINFDPQAITIYFQIKDEKVFRSVEIAPEIFVDLDADDDLIGVEMLRPTQLTILKKIAVQYHTPTLKDITSEHIPKAFYHAA